MSNEKKADARSPTEPPSGLKTVSLWVAITYYVVRTAKLIWDWSL